ncbi:dTDP-glucose 4,6-dehydratase [Paenibacillus cucumis (ex Kampfer et al. 2016)]|uniref:dTDP-glucose 4,6-dehydratase n=1 Tax=Paenibacillus cucumis (ex Kampfer et al. 2016) TaxID=1776858 RepID=A0ABS7KRM3_9BACL|nr:dTDP-glucose 4,6-dehydratase [Paenibacillus cucumis (ex Kampfer et al. 2016)]MBY0206805.1 dTDP-glucose 4,6-dehydratase [Paenibacillus cucumis (ex Kampfer et al. 2016)]
MNLLVTGGAGFIGSNFINYMLQHYPDYNIINVDSLTYAGNRENLVNAEGYSNYKFVCASILDQDSIEPLFQEGIDVIVNFAAESHVDRSIADPNVFVMTNIVGTQTLLELSRKYSVSKYVQVSTDEVYGSLGETGLFSETTPLVPNSPYSSSKAGADLLVRAYYETYGLPVNITRCSNNYGPYQFPEKLIPLMIIRAMNNKSLPVYGDGLNVRDWLYVEDHCSAIDLVIHKGVIGEIYNIGGNNEYTNINIVRHILQLVDKPDSLINYVEDRLGHDRRYAIDATKIKNELGWEPKHRFETGIKETVKWYQENPKWWGAILDGTYQQR